jgi:(4S)-4-hydroxy-5-phosphonooxypentane-2,3-dione isomerase
MPGGFRSGYCPIRMCVSPTTDRVNVAGNSQETESKRKIMLVVHVHTRVKPESIESFKQACVENARQSVQEPGIARFDVVQQQDDPARFVLVEVYRTPDAPAAHKETAHYQTWRDTVAPMMAEPRSSVKFTNLFPDDKGW